MPARLKIALVYGGRSAEHEVSLRSAKSIFEAMDKAKYSVIPVWLDLNGGWFEAPAAIESFDLPVSTISRLILSPDPIDRGFLRVSKDSRISSLPVDLVFPVLHGTYGEDGTIQGLLELSNMPYVGCGVAASSVGMDKVLMKAAFKYEHLNVGPFFWFTRTQWDQDRTGIVSRLGKSKWPVFVKPANLGSSVGITKVTDPELFETAVSHALNYDRKVLVEDGINGRELEVSVLGNDRPVASLPGEVVSHSVFYDYEEKYLRDSAELRIPAPLPDRLIPKVQDAAVKAFQAVDGSGLARVDMFVTDDDEVYVNEINTLPGFTSISMYPKLWEATGIPYSDLLDKLIDLAIERHSEKQRIKTIL
jgi:D-alanine-D-alanine ligase